ncbi:MAG: M12 family metallopeptidase [Oligoflexales bacterium]
MQQAYVAMVLSCLFLAAGCGRNENDSSLSGVVVSDYFLWPNRQAEVCWITPGYEDEKTEIQSAVVLEINRRTPFNFIGWKNCTGNDDTKLKVTILPDSHPHAHLGYIKGYGGTVEMFSYDFENDGFRGCEDTPQLCMRNTAVHEFGHALGLYHEQDRHDSKCKEGQEIDDGIPIGPYDRNSVMNYCNENMWTEYVSLSPGDIQAVNYLYRLPLAVDVSKFPKKMDIASGRPTTFPLQLAGDSLDTDPTKIQVLADSEIMGTYTDTSRDSLVFVAPEDNFSTISFVSSNTSRRKATTKIEVNVAQEADLAFDFSVIESALPTGAETCTVIRESDASKEAVYTASLDSKKTCRKFCDVVLPLAFSDRYKTTCEY